MKQVLAIRVSVLAFAAIFGAAKSFAVPTRVAVDAGWVEFGSSGYAISLDGVRVADRGVADDRLLLRYAEFDPLEAVPEAPPALAASEGSWIVQFRTPVIDAYRRRLAELGESAPIYLPSNSFIARVTAEDAARLARWAPVRWVGPYRPAYRLEPELADDLGAGPRRVYVQVFDRTDYTRRMVADRIALVGGQVDNLPSEGFWLEATLDPAQLLAVVRWPEVVWVDRWSPPEADMDIARQIGGGAPLETIEGIAGQGVRGEVMDTNVRDTHRDFASRPLVFHGARSGSTSHGTATTGIVFGDGASAPLARGMLPRGQGIFADYEMLTDRYRHTRELKESPYFAVFQSNSWGNTPTTDYTSLSAQMDDIIFQNDIVILQSQSNQGSRNSRPQAWAKNIVSIGGISHFNTLTKADDAWTSASYGPASDGRLKPDLSHFYDSIYTVSDSSDTGHTGGFGGTSGATPIIAGHFGLFFEMWAKGVFGNSVPGTTVFDAAPKFTLAKAFVVDTASPYPFTGAGSNLGRYRQGWGLADVGQLFASRQSALFVNETDVLAPFERRTYRVHVPAGRPWLRATMTYADLPGTTSSSQHRINKINLRVIAPNGVFYWGNNGLADGNASSPGGNPNNVDTVENVFVPNPAAGTWTIEVWARELNADGRLETSGEVDADFALVVTGVAHAFPAASVAATDGEAKSGDLASTETSDNERLVLENASGPAAELEARFQMPHRLADRIRVRVESRAEAGDCDLSVSALNLATGNFEEIAVGQVGAAESVIEVDAVRARKFLDASRMATLRFRWRRADGFSPARVGIDQLRAFFTPLPTLGGIGR